MKLLCALPVGVAITLLLGASAFADQITGLYNTGVNASGTPTADGSLDSHYTVTGSPDGSGLGSPGVYNSSGGYPIGPWLGDDSVSSWISPVGLSGGDGQTWGPAGNYGYETTFDVTGSSGLAGLSISGQFAADNGLTDVILNGTEISLSDTGGLGSWTSFTINQPDFTTGINTLYFIVNNADNPSPTGLRVEFNAQPSSAVPDSDLGMATPALAFGLLIGVSALFGRRNRRLLGSAAS